MKEILQLARIGFAFVIGIIGGLIGDFDSTIYTLIAFMFIDYITGVISAVCEKRLSSEIGAKGIVKKVVIIMVIAVANLLDMNIIGSNSTLRTMVVFFYLANEGISILENITVIGLPVPEKLKEILLQLRKEK